MIATTLAVCGGVLLALSARRFKRKDELPTLEGWALADRSLGTMWSWLLLGGTLCSAFTFIAVPGMVYGEGAVAFFVLPYAVITCSLAFVLLPRLWEVCGRHGYVTLGDFVRGRYGSGLLALAVAFTGILATMPYLALQLLGIHAVFIAAGRPPDDFLSHAVVIAFFAAIAVPTYHHGLRAPTVVSALKGVVILPSICAAVVLVLAELGSPEKVFKDAGERLAAAGTDASLSLGPGQEVVYATLAVGSALAVFMYPHVSTAAMAASSKNVLRRASVAIHVWTGVLGLSALLGIAAIAVGIDAPEGKAEAVVPMLVKDLMPAVFAGLIFGALVLSTLVPAAVMTIATATAFVRNIYVEYVAPTATPKCQVRVARLVSLAAKAGAIAFVFGMREQAAINLQLLGGVWILQTFPAVVVGLYTDWLRPRALLAGWAVGMSAGTLMVMTSGYSPVVPLRVSGQYVQVYAGLAAVLLNLAVAVALSAIFHARDALRRNERASRPAWTSRILRARRS